MKWSKLAAVALLLFILSGSGLFLVQKWRAEKIKQEYCQWWDLLSKEKYSKLEVKVPEYFKNQFAPVAFRQRYECFRSEDYSPKEIERVTVGIKNAHVYFIRKQGIGRTIYMENGPNGWFVKDTIGFWTSPFWD